MNKTKEAYKRVIVDFIVENYIELDRNLNYSVRDMSGNEINEKKSALKFMKNIIRTITVETDEEVQKRIDEAYDKIEEEKR